MTHEHDLTADEIVSRVLRCDDDQACLERPTRDEDDFLRRKSWGAKKIRENGLSLFRRKLMSANDIYRRLMARKKGGNVVLMPLHLGLTTCQFGKLERIHLQHSIADSNPEHVSIRCPDCDMADVRSGETCTPKSAGLCPFFEHTDPLSLVSIFNDDESPRLRRPMH